MKELIQETRNALSCGDFTKVLNLVRSKFTDHLGINHDVRNGLWSAAMILRYGPVGLQGSYLDDDGLKPEALDIPDVYNKVEYAKKRVHVLLDFLERENP